MAKRNDMIPVTASQGSAALVASRNDLPTVELLPLVTGPQEAAEDSVMRELCAGVSRR